MPGTLQNLWASRKIIPLVAKPKEKANNPKHPINKTTNPFRLPQTIPNRNNILWLIILRQETQYVYKSTHNN